MAIVGFQDEQVSLDVNEVCFAVQDIPNTHEKLMKSQSVTELCRCGKSDVMHANVECLSCGEVVKLREGYFQLSDMRYDDRNVVTERVQQSCNFN